MFRLIVHERVRAELQSLPAVVQAKMIHLLDKLRQEPLVLREPYSNRFAMGCLRFERWGRYRVVASTHFSAAESFFSCAFL